MKKKVKTMLLPILCSIFVLSGCKPQKEIVGKVAPLADEYKKQPIMEYFESKDRFISISSSKRIRLDNETLTSEGMKLEYYPEDKKAYGVHFFNYSFNDGKQREVNEVPVMLDENGYHVKEGYNLTEEIKNFKFMSEEVAFSQNYLQTLQIENSEYGFEVPSYSVTYLFNEENKDIENYLEEKNMFQYGIGYAVIFSIKGNSYSGGSVMLKIEEEGNFYINESFNQSVNESGKDYKGQFLGEEETTNE